MKSTSITLDRDTYVWLDQQPTNRSLTVRTAVSLYRKSAESGESDYLLIKSRSKADFDTDDEALSDIIKNNDDLTENELLVKTHTDENYVFRFWVGPDPLTEVVK